jgi:hypothetical protein
MVGCRKTRCLDGNGFGAFKVGFTDQWVFLVGGYAKPPS